MADLVLDHMSESCAESGEHAGLPHPAKLSSWAAKACQASSQEPHAASHASPATTAPGHLPAPLQASLLDSPVKAAPPDSSAAAAASQHGSSQKRGPSRGMDPAQLQHGVGAVDLQEEFSMAAFGMGLGLGGETDKAQTDARLGPHGGWFEQEGLADGSGWLPEATMDAFPGGLTFLPPLHGAHARQGESQMSCHGVHAS